MPQRPHEATHSGNYALGKTPGCKKKHVKTARGRVLAEGDVDPAAGLRDEPTRLQVEGPVAERKQGLRYKYTRSLFWKTNKGVPPLPLDFYRDPHG